MIAFCEMVNGSLIPGVLRGIVCMYLERGEYLEALFLFRKRLTLFAAIDLLRQNVAFDTDVIHIGPRRRKVNDYRVAMQSQDNYRQDLLPRYPGPPWWGDPFPYTRRRKPPISVQSSGETPAIQRKPLVPRRDVGDKGLYPWVRSDVMGAPQVMVERRESDSFLPGCGDW